MKRFTEYLNEDFDPAVFNADGGISIDDPTVIDAINSNLEMATSCSYRTPYNGLEEVTKTLAYYKIFLPKGVFLDQNHGNDVFEVSQFGEKTGMNNQGEVVTANDFPLFIYYEWSLNEKGMYDTFACLCNQDELDEILADFEAEVGDDETDLQEQHSMGKISKMLYKAVNQVKAQKQSDDVDSYIEHEKEGKTFTQICEEPMPNLNKRMAAKLGSKAVTLAKRMTKEETINEISKKLAHKASEKAYEAGLKHYDETSRKRRKALKSKDKKDMDAATAEQGKMSKKWKQSMRFKAYADKKMEEDYDFRSKQDAEDSAAIAKRARKPSEKAFWKKAYKKNNKKAVTGMDEEKEPFDPPFKKIERTEKKDAARARQLAKKAEKKAKAKKK